MPSCPTKSFAEFRSLRASPMRCPLRLRSLPGKASSPIAGGPKQHASSHASARSKPVSSASRHDDQSWKSVDAIPVRPASPRGVRKPRLATEWLAGLASALLTLTFSAGVRAQAPEDAHAQFQSGRYAFEQGDYAIALRAFEAALAGGLSGPAVHFNIGVAAYRLGEHRRAAAAFEESARTAEMAPLSCYNLGLIALAADKPREAKRWFARSRETDDERLRTLADAQLAKLEAQQPERTSFGYAALAAGYDDNVALVSRSEVLGVTGTEDAFGELQLAFAAPVGARWRMDGGAFLVDYQDLDAFDQLVLQGGASYRLPLNDWTGDIGVQLAHATLDGDSFENSRMLVLQAGTVLRDEWRLQARYRFSDLDGMSEFDGISGRQHEADARIAWTRGGWGVGFQYGLEISDHEDEALSAQRHQLRVDIERELPREWNVALETAVRHSRYDVEANRSENWTEVGLTLARPLTTRWRLVLRYAYADNDADRPEFDYSRSRASAGLEAVL